MMDNNIQYECAKEISQSKDDIQRNYKRVKSIYDSLMKATNIKFSISDYPDVEQKKFTQFLITVLDAEINYLKGDSYEVYPNRKLIDNLNKYDKDIDINPLANVFYNQIPITGCFHPVYNDGKKLIHIKNENAINIRKLRNLKTGFSANYQHEHEQIISYLNSCFKDNIDLRELGMINEKEDMQVYMLAESAYSELFLQSINYHILNNKILSKNERVEFLKEINDELESINASISLTVVKKNNIFRDFANLLLSVEQRNEKKIYVEILELLNNQMELSDYIRYVDERYLCNQRFMLDIQSKREIMEIIREGEIEKYQRFNERLEKCKDLCVILNISAGRNLNPEYLQHIKVVYREIIDDNLKYNSKTANTMLKDILEKGFRSIKESMFIREKISRGLFRECQLIDEYILKNTIQSNYYSTVLKIYANEIIYGEETSFIRYLNNVSEIMNRILKNVDNCVSSK